jgi:hypothetical protein
VDVDVATAIPLLHGSIFFDLNDSYHFFDGQSPSMDCAQKLFFIAFPRVPRWTIFGIPQCLLPSPFDMRQTRRIVFTDK